jgi:alpha-mannosidase
MQELGFDDEARGSENLVALNTLPWARSEMVRMPIVSDTPKYCLGTSDDMGIGSVQPLSAATPAAASIKEIKKGVYELANSRFKVEIADGVITSLYDKAAKREVIAKGGKANQLVIFDDKPLYWQAWDVEVFHLESRKELNASSSKILESGPHRVSVVTETRISEESWAKTTISLSATADDTTAAVEIEAEVEWKESMKFLKVEFPVDIVNTEASYETQYGIVKRPTHYNTTWDMAKFEVCCHKWADLSEAGYGVSILNDSKYGFATVGNLMRLSLLRAPKAPDAHADMGMFFIVTIRSWGLLMISTGRHHIRYSIFPHAGPLDHRTVRAGYALNNPMKLHHHASPASISSLLSSFKVIGSPQIILDCIKRGEDDTDVSVGALPTRKGQSIILRLYDSLGGKSKAVLTWGDIPVKSVYKTNALEDDGEKLEIIKGGGVEIEVRAFEVATYRLQL